MRRREFFASALAAGAAAATPGHAASPSIQYGLTILPPDRRRPGAAVKLESPIDTTVLFIDKANIERKYQDVLMKFKADNPSVDLSDPSSFLIVAKPKLEPGAVEVADCMCQCGSKGGCGGGGGGHVKKRPLARA